MIRSRSKAVDEFSKRAVQRSRKGSFSPKRDSRAYKDRSRVGKVRMINRAIQNPNMGGKVLGVRGYKGSWAYAKPAYVKSNFKLAHRDHRGRWVINRHHLHHNNGRWGYASSRYRGRNWHFYLSLTNDGWNFGVGYNRWNRRYYGDDWDVRFGWSSGAYIPTAYRTHGTYYFEPCYAFSFTFNHGYERGYMEGYSKGVRDWNSYYPYSSYPSTYLGYNSRLGTYSEYTDGYNQGFAQGYYAGYSGMKYGHENFGFGDFRNYPVIYDFDYDYYERENYEAGYDYDGYDGNGYEYEYDDTDYDYNY